MRVALDVTPLLGPRTGIADFVFGLASALPQDGIETSAFALSVRMRRHLPDRLPPGLDLWHLPFPARVARACWLRWNWPPSELVAGPCDVVHGTNYVVPPSRRAVEVVTVHDLSFVHFPQLSQGATLDFRRLLPAASNRGAIFHTHSKFVAAELAEWLGVEMERIVAAPGGIPDLEAIKAASPIDGRRLAGAERYVLGLGTEEPRKDYPSLIEAFAEVSTEVPDVRLVLAGPRGWGSHAVDEAIKESSVGHRIFRLGWVSDEQRNSLLKGAAVLAYPSVYEGFGYPPLQALAAGIPVVATSVGSLPEVLGNAARLVPAKDVGALVDAIGAELSGKSAASLEVRLARAGLYTWSGLADRLRATYETIVEERASGVKTRRPG